MGGTPKPLLAYSVQADEHGCVRFARSGAEARRTGAWEMDLEWEDIISCRRAPQLDRFSPGPVPEAALWEDGWFFFCAVCDCRVAKDYDGNLVDGRFFCSQHDPNKRPTPGRNPK